MKRQLERWVQAGVLDPEVAKNIERYEASQESFSIGTWILGLGIVAIGIGLVALVASNWDGISASVKLACDFALLLGLGWAVLRTQERPEQRMRGELCIGILFFFTLASMALVGQIYQIDAPLSRTLLTWFLVTTPLMLLSKSSFLPSIWALLAVVVYIAQVRAFDRIFEDVETLEFLLPVYIWCGPLLFRAIGANDWFVKQFSDHALALRRASDLTAILGAASCTTIWYASQAMRGDWGPGIGVMAIVLLVALLFRKKLWPTAKPSVLWLTLGLWGTALFSLGAGILVFREDELPVVAALFQLGMIALKIVLAIQAGQIRQFRFWVGAGCLRLLVVYFEIFGSLLDTGIALIGGGILIVVLAALWRKVATKWDIKDAKV